MKNYDGKRINALLKQIRDENPKATFEQAATQVIAAGRVEPDILWDLVTEALSERFKNNPSGMRDEKFVQLEFDAEATAALKALGFSFDPDRKQAEYKQCAADIYMIQTDVLYQEFPIQIFFPNSDKPFHCWAVRPSIWEILEHEGTPDGAET